MKLEVISPEKILFSGDVELVTVPGTVGSFTILPHHAPIISSLKKGVVVYRVKGEDVEMNINGGFIEMRNDIISVCVE
jgi:ATP synthase, F1 epsilon subunit (delta in mitochondria)